MYLGATIKQQCGKEFNQKLDFVTKEVGGGGGILGTSGKKREYPVQQKIGEKMEMEKNKRTKT